MNKEIMNYLNGLNINATELQVNMIDEDCFDYYMLEKDYLDNKEILDIATKNRVYEIYICGIKFMYFSEEDFYRDLARSA